MKHFSMNLLKVGIIFHIEKVEDQEKEMKVERANSLLIARD